MKVQIEIKNVYGRNIAYPVNETARGFALIAGTKTLTRSVVCYILGMGCTVDVLARGIVVESYSAGRVGHLPAID